MPRTPYVPIPVHRWGVLLRCHRRAEHLPAIFKNIRYLSCKRKAFVAIMVDRPSPAVVCGLSRELRKIARHPRIDVEIFESPRAQVDTRENYAELLQVHYDYCLDMAGGTLDAASLWDDDMWFEKAGLRELRGHLDILKYDRVDVRSFFLWDSYAQANERFAPHWQAIVFRSYPRDKFPEDYIVHCPHRVACSAYAKRMRHRLYNAGYISADERKSSWDMYRRAGKIDRHTCTLLEDPDLVDIPCSRSGSSTSSSESTKPSTPCSAETPTKRSLRALEKLSGETAAAGGRAPSAGGSTSSTPDTAKTP